MDIELYKKAAIFFGGILLIFLIGYALGLTKAALNYDQTYIDAFTCGRSFPGQIWENGTTYWLYKLTFDAEPNGLFIIGSYSMKHQMYTLVGMPQAAESYDNADHIDKRIIATRESCNEFIKDSNPQSKGMFTQQINAGG
ncbi:Uncharacterised protein [uncultured archaeon]|nr:Uncharacterised protein [uncultured archaeon]